MTNDDNTYVPVSCDMHSQYELLIMHNCSIELNWQNENGDEFSETVKPQDSCAEQSYNVAVATVNPIIV